MMNERRQKTDVWGGGYGIAIGWKKEFQTRYPDSALGQRIEYATPAWMKEHSCGRGGGEGTERRDKLKGFEQRREKIKE